MGSIKKIRRKYNTPTQLYNKDRILREKEYMKEYGMKNAKEVWKMDSVLSRFKNLAKKAISSNTAQSAKESQELLKRLRNLGLLNEASMLSDVLTLTTKDILERRLQTQTLRRGVVRTIKQARQFITHNHITVDGRTITSPSYIVTKSEEDKISYNPTSALSLGEHPERAIKMTSRKTAPPKRTDDRKFGRRPDRRGRKEHAHREFKKKDE